MFKYFSHAGAVATLRNRTVQLSAPAAFNDPFDTHLDDPLGLDPAEFVQELQGAFLAFILGDIDYAALREGPHKNEIIRMHEALRAATPEQREGYRQEAMSDDAARLYDIEDLSRSSRYISEYLTRTFSRYGIFCASTRSDVLLLWSHYASEHKGFAFELIPNADKDSAFLTAKPVVYTNVRPLMYRTPLDMINKSFLMSREEATKEIVHSIIYSKAQEWSYEAELRLYIPDFVEEGQTRAYLQFHPEELATLYIGCRASDEDKREVIDLARDINPNVRVEFAFRDPREYKLNFRPVE